MSYHYYLLLSRLRRGWAKELEGMSVPVREATIFCKVLEKMPLHIHDGDLFAGWYGYETPEERETIYTVPGIRYVPEESNKPVDLIARHGYYPGGYDRAHHELDYRYLLEGGIKRVKARVEAELAKPGNDEEKIDYLNGMMVLKFCVNVMPVLRKVRQKKLKMRRTKLVWNALQLSAARYPWKRQRISLKHCSPRFLSVY